MADVLCILCHGLPTFQGQGIQDFGTDDLAPSPKVMMVQVFCTPWLEGSYRAMFSSEIYNVLCTTATV